MHKKSDSGELPQVEKRTAYITYTKSLVIASMY
jgi:hypothetical protein